MDPNWRFGVPNNGNRDQQHRSPPMNSLPYQLQNLHGSMNIGNPAAAMRNFLSVQQMNQGNQIFNSPSLNNRIYYPNNSYIQNDEVLRRAQLSLFGGADQFHMNLLASQQNSANHLRDEYMKRLEIDQQEALRFREFLASKSGPQNITMMKDQSYPESFFSRINGSNRSQYMVDFKYDSIPENATNPDDRSSAAAPPLQEKKHSLDYDSGIHSRPIPKRLRASISSEKKMEVLENDQEHSLNGGTNKLELASEHIPNNLNGILENNLEAEKRSKTPNKSSDCQMVQILDGAYSENGHATKCSINKQSDELESSSRDTSTSSNDNVVDTRGIELLAGVIGKLPRMENHETDPPLDLLKKSNEGLVNLEQSMKNVDQKASRHYDSKDRPHKKLTESGKSIHSTTWLSSLPSLPIEPELNPTKTLVHGNSISETNRLLLPHEAPLDVKEPLFLSKSLPNHSIDCDPWYPSNKAILRERKTQGMIDADKIIMTEVPIPDGKVPISTSVHDRLKSNMEPGSIEKLPHCKLYEQMYLSQNDENPRKPLFCFQVTEVHCKSMMVCCSKCSTWRHVQCGGHFSRTIPRREMSSFNPVCDRCYAEEFVLEKYPQARSRIERQRIIHLRKTQTVGSVIRSAAYSKLGSQNWPPGSVESSQMSSHKKSILTRFAKAEKQWDDMLVKLGLQERSGNKLAPLRSKEFERILQYLQDSEVKCDLHNAILFLQRDSQREHPTGHETPLFNLFDPEDDSLRILILKEKNGSIDDINESSDEENEIIGGENDLESTKDEKSKDLAALCMRTGCKRSARFDSHFCTDACGILTMELDLLQTLKLAEQVHPSNLRH